MMYMYTVKKEKGYSALGVSLNTIPETSEHRASVFNIMFPSNYIHRG